MKQAQPIRRIASRAAAHLVAVAAVATIFAAKTLVRHEAHAAGGESRLAAASSYDPYLTEQP